MYKLHSEFTRNVDNAIKNRLPSIKVEIQTGLLQDIIYLSRMGVLVEGADGDEQQRVNGKAALTITAPPAIVRPQYSLSLTSRTRLECVHPKLKSCIELAITLSTVDFRVQETLRSMAAQQTAVASGNSRTLHSKHFKQSDGFVWAADLVCLVDGVVDWDFNIYSNIAFAMDRAATQLGIAGHIRWGCAWDRVLSDFGGSPKAYLAEAAAYAKRHAGSDLMDAPHFEWVA